MAQPMKPREKWYHALCQLFVFWEQMANFDGKRPILAHNVIAEKCCAHFVRFKTLEMSVLKGFSFEQIGRIYNCAMSTTHHF
jgi:hypothetical protein